MEREGGSDGRHFLKFAKSIIKKIITLFFWLFKSFKEKI
jgi:hypothetical protein